MLRSYRAVFARWRRQCHDQLPTGARNYPRSLRSAAQRWNISLNARRALANLAARSRAVTAVVKSIVLMSFLPAQVSAMLFMQHDTCGKTPTRVTIVLIAHAWRREHQGLDLQKQGSKIPEFLHIGLGSPNIQYIVSYCIAVKSGSRGRLYGRPA